MMKTFRFNIDVTKNIYFATIVNLFTAMVFFTLCRIVFLWENQSFFPDLTAEYYPIVFGGGLRFDLTALLYANSVYILLMLIPFRFRYKKAYQTVAKWFYLIPNAICILINLMDTVYFKFTNRRTAMSVFSEFENDDNLLQIIGVSMVEYWYLSLIFLVMIFVLYKLYFAPKFQSQLLKGWFYYVANIVALCLSVFFVVSGIRGGFGYHVRPITLSNARAYVQKSSEAAVVLNTPFCMMRTLGDHPYVNPKYFATEEKLKSAFEPVIYPHPSGEFHKKNVVIFILEGFSREFFASLNKDIPNYKGYTPFLDSLVNEGLTFEHTFANGRKSIDAMPSVLASIPMFYTPYILTPYSNNDINGIASLLNKKGYYTAFFHGAPNGSMGFDSFARAAGFKDYYGLTEYGNKDDYDGIWAVWDEEFFQFYADKMAEFQQPFLTAIFSATSHHPFQIPERYKNIFPEEGGSEMYKCVRYTDNAIRLFFENAKKQPWFENTLFVFTADHTNQLRRKENLTDAGFYKIPIIFYTPNGDLRGYEHRIAQQNDIMPTILGYLNYDEPYVAFGKNLLDAIDDKKEFVVNYNSSVFQYFRGNLMLQYDEKKWVAAYDYVNDIYLKNNILSSIPQAQKDSMESQLKAVIQQYNARMIENRLTLKK